MVCIRTAKIEIFLFASRISAEASHHFVSESRCNTESAFYSLILQILRSITFTLEAHGIVLISLKALPVKRLERQTLEVHILHHPYVDSRKTAIGRFDVAR
jgi:hypothetical protein